MARSGWADESGLLDGAATHPDDHNRLIVRVKTRVPFCQELGVWTFPQPGEALQLSTKSRSTVGGNAGPVRLLLQCSRGVCRGSGFFGYTAENSHHLKARIISKDPLF